MGLTTCDLQLKASMVDIATMIVIFAKVVFLVHVVQTTTNYLD
jgi:hypothetical protein